VFLHRRCFLILCSYFFIAHIAFNSLQAEEKLRIVTIGTGSTAGTYFPIGGLLGNAISNPPGSRPCNRGGSCGVPGMIAVAQSTRGSLENILSVHSSKIEMALSQADVAYWAFYGSGYYQGQSRKDALRAIANLFPENIHLITKVGSSIESIRDLKGKRVSIGSLESGSRVDARLILSAYGLRFSSMKLLNLDLEPSVEALVSGQIDAFFFVGGAPALAIVDLANRLPLNFVPIDGPIATKLSKIFPFFAIGKIPQGAYADNEEVATLDVGAILIANKSMSEEIAFGIASAIWHPRSEYIFKNGHPRGKFMDIKSASKGIEFFLHPGAKKYYMSRGVYIKEESELDLQNFDDVKKILK